jgi:histidyl-tRNA synthetase
VAENFQNLALPYRSYRTGFVFRNEKPGPGRFRQFMQFDADTVGSASMAADAEMCMLAADTMEALGIPRGSYVVKVNNRKVLDGVMEVAGVLPSQRLTVLRAIDKLDRLGIEGVRQLLGTGRKDESGDFTRGAGLTADQISAIEPILLYRRGSDEVTVAVTTEDPQNPKFETLTRSDINKRNINPSAQAHIDLVGIDNVSALGYIKAVFHRFGGDHSTNLPSYEGYEELRTIAELTNGAGYADRIFIDPSVVRGLEYYTGPVYEVELTFEINDEKGRPVRFGSVGGGGRYDGLVSRFMGQPVPATGFSIGVSRLQAALTALGKLDNKAAPGPVVVTVFDKDRVADYQRMVSALRNANVRAELYLGNPKNIGNQLKYADRRNAPCVVIQGGDEKAKGEVTVKDLIAGAELAKLEKGRDEYLQKQAEAQIAVKEENLIDEVRKLLARHGIG